MRKPRKRVLVGRADGDVGVGIGRFLLEAGWDLSLIGNDEAVLDSVAAWAPVCGCDASVALGDLGDRDFLATLQEDQSALDALVICADLECSTPLDAERPDLGDSFDALMEENLAGTFGLVRGAIGRLSEGGRIVIVTTGAARQGTPDGHGVAASHAGVVGMTRALALELAPKGITVNAVLRASAETTPIGRSVTPQDVAETLVWLLGPGASAITGQAINVCGGLTA